MNAVASCMQPGMSMVAAVTMAQGVNANLLRRWVRDAEMNSGTTVVSATTAEGPKAYAEILFVPIILPPPVQRNSPTKVSGWLSYFDDLMALEATG
ncbi:hypothetical protein ACSFBX_30450 [Variovorax sp. RB2P76]|uniref:hypothetical protein n=1 Tax=Variovorax sp. RB2P76 TaxID=3443736 RepID=UPI003F4722A4